MPWLDLEGELTELFASPHVLSGEAALPRHWRELGDAWGGLELIRDPTAYRYRGRKEHPGQWLGPAPAPGLPDYRPRLLGAVQAEHRAELARKGAAKRAREKRPEQREIKRLRKNAYRARMRAG